MSLDDLDLRAASPAVWAELDRLRAEKRNARCLIWSEEHGKWWKAGGWGYTNQMRSAGIFTREHADRIVADANLTGFNEVVIPDPSPIPIGYRPPPPQPVCGELEDMA